MFNKHDPHRNECMLTGDFSAKGYDWWWHSFTAIEDASGKEVPFFIEYYLINPALAKKEPVLGQLPSNKATGEKPSYLMVKAGCWGENRKQLHRFFSWKEIDVHYKAPWSILAEGCFASDTELRGKIELSKDEVKSHPEYMSDAGYIKWDLKVDKQIAFNVGYGTSPLFRRMKAFEMYWHAEGMKSQYRGKIQMDGKNYTVFPDTCFGYADKNWGSGFTSPWLWLSSNDIISQFSHERLDNTVFDIGGGRPKAFGIPFERKLLGALWYEGKGYEYNFSKFWTMTRQKFSVKETETEIIWYVELQNVHSVMRTEIHCQKKDMIFVNYEDPEGIKRFSRLWNGGNGSGTVWIYRKDSGNLILIDELIVGHVGCEYGEFDSDANAD